MVSCDNDRISLLIDLHTMYKTQYRTVYAKFIKCLLLLFFLNKSVTSSKFHNISLKIIFPNTDKWK